MKKEYVCEPVLILRGGKACTAAGEPVEDPASYFAAEAAKGAVLGFFLDESETDEEHEAALGQIRRYTRQGTLPVLAGGRTRRLEDVKKYIYAGARAAMLRRDDEREMAVRDEAVSRFGAGRVALYRQADARGADEAEGPMNEMPHGSVTVEEPDRDLSWAQFKTGPDGLLPCIVQDVHTGQVLMMAYMNEEAFRRTCRTGRMTYYSRSRQSLWLKGETSGHFQYVKSLRIDCDNDTILAKVRQVGPACHTGARSCFFKTLTQRHYKQTNPLAVFEEVFDVIRDRKEHPKEGSYTNYLFDKGLDKILKKLGEEATEIVIAAKNPNPEEIKYEIADFLYHMMVLMAQKGVGWEEIMEELANR